MHWEWAGASLSEDCDSLWRVCCEPVSPETMPSIRDTSFFPTKPLCSTSHERLEPIYQPHRAEKLTRGMFLGMKRAQLKL